MRKIKFVSAIILWVLGIVILTKGHLGLAVFDFILAAANLIMGLMED